MKISFLSSRGRGFTPDFAVLQTTLRKHLPGVRFQRFCANEISRNPYYAEGMKHKKAQFYQGAGHIICADMSLDAQVGQSETVREKLLVGACYDYFFKAMLTREDNPGTKRLRSFMLHSHILNGSPFVKKVLESCYNVGKISKTDGVCTPFSWDLCQKERREKVRRECGYRFPQIQENKVLAVIYSGKKKTGPDTLPEPDKGWCTLTPEEGIAPHLLLYLADALVTNDSYMAASFAATKKPLFVGDYSDNWFEKYVAKHYPDYILPSSERFQELLAEATQNQSLQELLSYPGEQNPTEAVLSILL